jgi:hypothetical protein
MKLLGIKIGITAAFHPAADGQSERRNQTIEIALRCFLGGNKDNYRKWTEYLPILEHKINSTPNVSTRFSLNELRFAVKPHGLADLFYPWEGTSDSAERLTEELKNKCDDAWDSIAVAQPKQRKYFNERQSRKEFQEGDLVVLKFNWFGPGYKPQKPHDHKLAPIGTPLRVLEKLSPLSYRLAITPNPEYTMWS